MRHIMMDYGLGFERKVQLVVEWWLFRGFVVEPLLSFSLKILVSGCTHKPHVTFFTVARGTREKKPGRRTFFVSRRTP
jgi:hypothetical protein